MAHAEGSYYVPHGSHWPIVGSVGLFVTMLGAAMYLNGFGWAGTMMYTGMAIILFMIFGWFRTVINESEGGRYHDWEDRSFRMGMIWFIFSEVMFFAAFFGALFYARVYAVPFLSGESNNFFTGLLVWPDFEATWPTNGPANAGGDFEVMGPWGLPALNTAILLASGVTLTIAHHALQENRRLTLNLGLLATIILGFLFIGFQAEEYYVAYTDMNLQLDTGIYGSTFFMLTGFHGMHVTLGAIMLTVILFRCLKGHFTPNQHFGFEAVAWYWHFVDVVWLGLFIFVYWL